MPNWMIGLLLGMIFSNYIVRAVSFVLFFAVNLVGMAFIIISFGRFLPGDNFWLFSEALAYSAFGYDAELSRKIEGVRDKIR